MLAEVSFGGSWRGGGTGVPASSGTHVTLYPVLSVGPVLV